MRIKKMKIIDIGMRKELLFTFYHNNNLKKKKHIFNIS